MHGHKYTEDERAFFQEFVPGHTYKEIQGAFRSRFGWDITIGQVKGYMANHKINSGTKGRFEKGHVPANKGRKGTCPAGCAKSWFRQGHTPKNHRPVGSERVSKDGYIEVKVGEPGRWRLKHRVVWEKAFGKIPPGKCVIFLNGDKTDVRVENLAIIDRNVNVRLNQSGLRYQDADSTRAAIEVGVLLAEIGKAKKRRKRGEVV